MSYEPSYECVHCGRVWTVRRPPSSQQALRMMLNGIEDHQTACARKTPAQRQVQNRRDEARWRTCGQSLVTRVTNNPQHPGLQVA